MSGEYTGESGTPVGETEKFGHSFGRQAIKRLRPVWVSFSQADSAMQLRIDVATLTGQRSAAVMHRALDWNCILQESKRGGVYKVAEFGNTIPGFFPMRNALLTITLIVTTASLASAAQVDDKTAIEIATPRETIFERGVDPSFFAAASAAADKFYGFWNNGSPALLESAISETFVDHTLPAGRPQGPTGPALASKAFLAAVPDLRAEVVQRIVVGDRVVSHLRFTGHFTGEFMSRKGNGQTVDFIATDILRVQNGRITDNWHLEDNLTFLQQIGVIAKTE